MLNFIVAVILLILTPDRAFAVTYGGVDKTGLKVETIAAPPILVVSQTGGTIAAGTYYYAMTEITANGETSIGGSSLEAVITTATGKVTLSWPVDAVATSYKVYRTITQGVYTGSTFLTTTTNATSYVDDGSVALTSNPPPVVSTNSDIIVIGSDTTGDLSLKDPNWSISSSGVVTASKLSTGDIDLTCKDFTCEWTLFEHVEGLFLYNKRTKVSFQIQMVPVSSDIVPIE